LEARARISKAVLERSIKALGSQRTTTERGPERTGKERNSEKQAEPDREHKPRTAEKEESPSKKLGRREEPGRVGKRGPKTFRKGGGKKQHEQKSPSGLPASMQKRGGKGN